jgi:3-hydroxyisobutyrate dehydrogenase-like beta-hydroxyacid dehydrogenase
MSGASEARSEPKASGATRPEARSEPKASEDHRVGFIGTGTIGAPMAKRLLDAGHLLVVCDRVEAATGPLVEAGATRAASPREVAAACRVVFTSLPGPREVEEVATGKDGLLAGAQAGDIHVDLSTSAFEAVRALAAREAAAGVQLVDAPVSGGVMGAAQGTLTVMASGERAAFERVEKLLGAFGKNIFYLGESGNGTLTKLVNNAIFLCGGLLVQETFAMAAKAGLDPNRLLEVVQKSSGAAYAGMAKLLLGRGFDNAFFQLALAEKDVGLAVASAQGLGVRMPVIEAAHATYARALAMGLGPKLFAATLLAVEEAAGVEVPPLS